MKELILHKEVQKYDKVYDKEDCSSFFVQRFGESQEIRREPCSILLQGEEVERDVLTKEKEEGKES